MPFFDFVARVALRDLVPAGMGVVVVVGRTSTEERAGRVSAGSDEKGMSWWDTGTERRLASRGGSVGKRSFRVAVLAREGRGGGEDIVDDFEWREGFEADAAANGSRSTRVVGDARLSLRARGGGFWRELRTFWEAGRGEGGACLVGTMFASLRRSEYSWMDSREGRWYSMVIFECRLELVMIAGKKKNTTQPSPCPFSVSTSPPSKSRQSSSTTPQTSSTTPPYTSTPTSHSTRPPMARSTVPTTARSPPPSSCGSMPSISSSSA